MASSMDTCCSHARRAGVYARVWSVPKVDTAAPAHPFHSFSRVSGPRPRGGGWSLLRGRGGGHSQWVLCWLWAGPWGGRGGTETPPRWGVWPLRQGPAGGKRAPRPPAARAPPPPARDGVPLVSCRLLGKLVLLLSDSSPQTLRPGRALAAGDGRHEIRA